MKPTVPEITISRERGERIGRLIDAGTKCDGRSLAAMEIERLTEELRPAVEARRALASLATDEPIRYSGRSAPTLSAGRSPWPRHDIRPLPERTR